MGEGATSGFALYRCCATAPGFLSRDGGRFDALWVLPKLLVTPVSQRGLRSEQTLHKLRLDS